MIFGDKINNLKGDKMLKKISIVLITAMVFTAALKAQSWAPLVSGTTTTLRGVHFPNEQTGYIVGANNVIRKTTNGGLNWVSQNSSLIGNFDLLCVYFVTPDIGWVCGTNNRIVYTNNGGANWSLQSTGSQTNILYSLHFINSSTGWVVGENGYMRRTVNGGLNWLSQGSGTANTLLSVYFPGGASGWIAGESGNIRRSFDYGVNWAAQTSQPNLINSLFFLDDNTGYAVGQNGLIRKTVNGGNAWNTLTSGVIQEFRDVQFINANTGWIVGFNNTIIKTTNAGSSWLSDISGTNTAFYSVHFPSSNVGYVVGTVGNLFKYSVATSVNTLSTEVPAQFRLYTNYPNPFNPVTKIKFDISRESDVNITVYDILGKVVSVPVDQHLSAGKYDFEFNASSLASGSYFYRMTAGSYSEMKKMVIVK